MSNAASPTQHRTEPRVRCARFAALSPATLYALLRLRVDVFVVEQECAYPELDGRDTEPGTEHLWIELDGVPAACLRILADPAGPRIGRVATAARHRGRGLAAELIDAALERIGQHSVDIGAQSQLADWYARFGFVRSGPDYLEDGIWHLPMRREPGV